MITVFYANQVYGQYHLITEFKAAISAWNTPEIYNGGYVYVDMNYWILFGSPGWYRCDGTPYPDDQIDPRMKAWILLLG